MLDINVAQIFIAFIVLLFSLTVHEMAHAWTADRLGDPTARLLGRVSLNPLVHADPIGTVLFPLIAMMTRRAADRLGEAGAGQRPQPAASPARLRARRGGRSGEQSVMAVTAAMPAGGAADFAADARRAECVGAARDVSQPGDATQRAAGGLQHDSDSAARRRQCARGSAAASPGRLFNQIRPYGFILLYALMLTGGFD